jgi:hypothetical protein
VTERRNAWAHSRCVARQRDLQARIDAALALCDTARVGTSAAPRDCTEACGDGDCNCSGLFRALSWSLDPEAVRAALVGDQPNAKEPPAPRCHCNGPTHVITCPDQREPLSGEALRAVEEADDAAGDLP